MLNIESLRFPSYELPPALDELRREVRAFLEREGAEPVSYEI